MTIQWYPGHMHSTFKFIKNKIKDFDLIVEILDARIPFSSQNPEFDKIFSNKEKIIRIMNKTDLADSSVTKKWINKKSYFSSNLKNSNDIKKIKNFFFKFKKKKQLGFFKVLILGVPNVGKSTLINKISGKKINSVRNEPGVTKKIREYYINSNFKIYDTPGLMWPKILNRTQGNYLALCHAIDKKIYNPEDIAIDLGDILVTHYQELIKKRYKLNAKPKSGLELIEFIANKNKSFKNFDTIVLRKVSDMLVQDFRSGITGKISLEFP